MKLLKSTSTPAAARSAAIRSLGVATVLVLAFATSACAENWNYDIESKHHNEKTGRYYVVCRSGFTETYKEVDVTADVYNLLKIDRTCPEPMPSTPTNTTEDTR